jgi:hypothetical protein
VNIVSRTERPKTKHSKKRRKRTIRRSNPKTLLRVFEALNLSRRKKMSPSAAAAAAGTTLSTVKRVVPDALIQGRPRGPIRVKPSDRYEAQVEILEKSVGPSVVVARGSRQRELAGKHRAVYERVLRKVDPPSALDQFRGKKVGGYELVSHYDELLTFAKAGYLSQLDTLYVLPEATA